jgi:hypothetical protein
MSRMAVAQAIKPVQNSPTQAGGVLQRKCDKCRKKKPLLKRATTSSSPETVPPIVHEVLRSPGQPLDAKTRAFMEPRFGHDFSRIRLHTDAKAAESAQALNALAFTVGPNIVFGADRYAPMTREGQRLLAHEMTHVLQQEGYDALNPQLTVGSADDQFEREANAAAAQVLRGEDAEATRGLSTNSVQTLQCDLATPPPAVPAPAQPDLTPAQIQAAIAFNRARYDAASTSLIQDLVGTKPTGIWVEDDIVAIASLQEEYRFNKDGMVGPRFFRFLDEEVRREGLSRTDESCLLAFHVISSPQTVGPIVGGSRSITGQFRVRAQFSSHCGCADYEYRQFIRGHWRRERAGVVTDLGGTFTTQPAGRLNAAFDEDGNTDAAALNYGHRAQPAETINHYLDDTGAEDQANGCIYESEDAPGGPDNVLPGDIFDIDVNFRGEIQRTGRVVRTLHWSAIRGRFPVP